LQIVLWRIINIITIKMSKSPIKDFSRLIEPNTRTVKKEEIRRE